MEMTTKNIQTAQTIVKVLNERQCTVAEAIDIMSFVKNAICTTTTVHANIDTQLLI